MQTTCRRCSAAIDVGDTPAKCGCGAYTFPVAGATKPGWGDKAAAFFKRLGYRQTPSCGCAERQAKLNRFGWRITRWLRR